MDEIAALRIDETAMQRSSEEADRMVRDLMPHYACNFVLAELPPNGWAAMPDGWQAGCSEPVPFNVGYPPRDRRGAVGVSLAMLRALARLVRR